MNKKQPEISFWVSNISNRNVSLGDLALTIPAFSSVNLMDTRHYHYTLEQINKSVQSGSIFNKRNRICVRKYKPESIKTSITIVENSVIPSRERSTFQMKQEVFEELLTTDDEYADENADFVAMDEQKHYFTKE